MMAMAPSRKRGARKFMLSGVPVIFAEGQLSASGTGLEKVKEREFERMIGNHTLQRAAQPFANRPHFAGVCFEPPFVIGSGQARIEKQVASCLEILEPRSGIEGELHL